MTFESFLRKIAETYRCFRLVLVADSAASNIKFLLALLVWLSNLSTQTGLLMLAYFDACMLHQLARIIIAVCDWIDVTNGMYSITRIHQQTRNQDQTKSAILHGVRIGDLFKFYPAGQHPPATPTTGSSFRANLLQLLFANWTCHGADIDKGSCSANQQAWTDAFAFFNGCLLLSHLSHLCNGCCKNEREAKAKAS